MSFLNSAKEFFGLAPMDMEADDAYYHDEPRYTASGETAYGHRYEQTAPAAVAVAERYQPTIVPISLTSYNDAQKVGEPFRDGDAVVFELTDADKGAAKRFVDFAAGLCFALRGRMVNLTKGMNTDRKVFAILPENANISTLELERAAGLR